MSDEKRNLHKEIREKLLEEPLRANLGKFAERYPATRAAALENAGDVEALREAIRKMKAATVDRIEEVAAQFELEATRRGVKVFRAKNGDEVKRYIGALCKKHDVKGIIKSKSMASEEIDLSPYLRKNGLHVCESDMGEWIIDLAGHRPSHMVIPAIHLSRFQVAELFSKEMGKELPPDIPLMIKAAREHLRQEFLNADMGITGANFGIAENGAIGLITNEGNARFATTLPRIHVVVMGYEKLLPKMTDAGLILKLLPRGATGQLMTSYTSFIGGPSPMMVRKEGRWVEETREMHIILLDNNRLQSAKDERFKEVYQCVRCGSCLNVCPVYTIVGGHVYGGHTYAGGIGAILTAMTSGMADFEKFHELCIGCRRCVEVCPGKINIPGLIEELRTRAVQQHGLPFVTRQLFENVMANRKVFHALLRAASVTMKPFASGKNKTLIRHLPLFFSGLAKDRSLPTIAEKPLRDRVETVIKKPAQPAGKAAFFSGCTMDFVLPETGEAIIKVLEDLGYEVVFPLEQSCCGKPISATGDVETAKKIALLNVQAFAAEQADVIVSGCPTCIETLESYGELLKDNPEWRGKAAIFSSKVKEFSSFVAAEYEKRGRLQKTTGGPAVTYHDSCHLKRVLGVSEAPRKLLEAAGCELREMKDSDKCCGMSGVFGLKYVELSMKILDQKMKNVKDTGAGIVACACSGCMVQLQGGVDKQLPGVRMKHIADILAERLVKK
ncbi:MAG: LUD domain-containing protein [Syntrophobacterales bacterium]|nr:LUD domain-containing protein [Syntrophobacterales bacterium]